ncbi:MAG: hypothetical protein ACRC1K_16115, partial [Planctomycetia bacterium]
MFRTRRFAPLGLFAAFLVFGTIAPAVAQKEEDGEKPGKDEQFEEEVQIPEFLRNGGGFAPPVTIRQVGSSSSLRLEAFSTLLEGQAKANFVDSLTQRQLIKNRVLRVQARLAMYVAGLEKQNVKWDQKMLDQRKRVAERLDVKDRSLFSLMELPVTAAQAGEGNVLNKILEAIPATTLQELDSAGSRMPLTPSITADVRVEQGVGAKKAVLSLEKGGGYTFVAPRSVSKAELKP